jgi:hypothetical protein
MCKLRGSFQKFCTLYVFSLKMNLFYKIHLQAFNVISIVLYHSGQTFGQVLYSCLDAFVIDVSDYSGHLVRHLLNASEAFPRSSFFKFWEQVKVSWAHVRTVRRVGKHLPSILFQNFRYYTWGTRPHEIWPQSVYSSISRLRFAGHGPRSLPVHTHTRTQCSLLTSDSQLAKIRTIASPYWPRKRSVQNFWNDVRMLTNRWKITCPYVCVRDEVTLLIHEGFCNKIYYLWWRNLEIRITTLFILLPSCSTKYSCRKGAGRISKTRNVCVYT